MRDPRSSGWLHKTGPASSRPVRKDGAPSAAASRRLRQRGYACGACGSAGSVRSRRDRLKLVQYALLLLVIFLVGNQTLVLQVQQFPQALLNGRSR